MDIEQEIVLKRYADVVSASPSFLGLTSSTDRSDFFERHVLDAAELLQVLSLPESNLRVIDVGTGNGVPGLVWAILRPLWNITLLDSDTKKCGFIESFVISVGLKNVSVVCKRAELAARSGLREQFDVAVSRALGPLTVTLELISGFVQIEGLAIVSRGTSPESYSPGILSDLSLVAVEEYAYSVGSRQYSALKLSKSSPLGQAYPRGVGRPAKRPLGST